MSTQDEMFDEVRQTLKDLKTWIEENGYGVRPNVTFQLFAGSRYAWDSSVSVYVYLNGDKNDGFTSLTKPTLAEVIAGLKTEIVARCSKTDEETIEKMALAIIRIRHSRGEVTDRDLSLEFSEFHLKRLLAESVNRACEMAADAPFEVLMVREEKNASVDLEQEVSF